MTKGRPAMSASARTSAILLMSVIYSMVGTAQARQSVTQTKGAEASQASSLAAAGSSRSAGEDITITSLPVYATNGTIWPYQDLYQDRRRYGTPTKPLTPRVGNAAFFTPFMREAYLGPGHLGGLQAGFFLGQIRGAPAPSQVNWNYTALQTLMSATGNLGGTGTTMTAGKGQVFGFSPLAVLYPGATDILNVTGGEINVQVNRGASVAYKSGLQIVGTAADAVQGSTYDAALSISNQNGAIGFRYGILFSAANGRNALSADGTLIGVMNTPSLANGIDLTDAAFSTNAFASRGYSVDGSGMVHGRGFVSTTVGATVSLGARDKAGSSSVQFRTSGSTTGDYDAAITGYGGNGTQGNGGLSLDVSEVQPSRANQAKLGDTSTPWASITATVHRLAPTTYAHLPACDLANAGILAYISDALEAVTAWHQPITSGGGSHPTFVACLGSGWVAY